MILFQNNDYYSHQHLLLVALFWYVLAKVTELDDVPIFNYTQGIVSGHSIKHLHAAAGCCSILIMQRRKLIVWRNLRYNETLISRSEEPF